MIKQRKTDSITVSRISRHQTRSKKVSSQPGINRKQSISRVIHVVIGLPSNIPRRNNNLHPATNKVLTKDQIFPRTNHIFSTHRHDQQLLSQVRPRFR